MAEKAIEEQYLNEANIDLIPAEDVIKDIDNSKEIDKTVLQICSKFKYEIMRCINCPIILECSHPNKRLEPLKVEALKIAEQIYEEELELDTSAENTLRAQEKRDQTYKQYLMNNAYKQLQNERCVFERGEILNSLQKFVDAGYDITDPRAYIIINELISNILNSGRMNKTFTNLGIILRKDTPMGPIYYPNPLLKSKSEFSKFIVEATQILDQILKSDEKQTKANDFTAHLMKELRIRERKKHRVIEKLKSEGE